MTRFTLHDIQSKLSAGKIRGYAIPDKKTKVVQVVKGGENVAGLESMAPKRSKMGNVRTVDSQGRKFDSKTEMCRYRELEQWERLGVISDLRRQVVYKLSVCEYVADAVYVRDGVTIVEDTKSNFTRKNAVYRLKKKMMEKELNIIIHEYKK